MKVSILRRSFELKAIPTRVVMIRTKAMVLDRRQSTRGLKMHQHWQVSGHASIFVALLAGNPANRL